MIFLQSYNRISRINDIRDCQIEIRHKNKCPFENLKIDIVCKLAEQHGYRIFKFVRCVFGEKSRFHDQNLACHPLTEDFRDENRDFLSKRHRTNLKMRYSCCSANLHTTPIFKFSNAHILW